jgi:hypothetical protein
VKPLALAAFLAACSGPAPARVPAIAPFPSLSVETYVCQAGTAGVRITVAGRLVDVELATTNGPTRCMLAAVGPDQEPK